MSDELQEAFEGEDLPEVQESEQQDAREEAPAEEEGDKLSGYDKRISTLTARNYKLQQELDQLRASEKTEQVMVQQAPEVPDYPDDDLRIEDPAEWKKQRDAYNNAMHKRAIYDAKQEMERERQSQAKKEQAMAAQSRNQEIVGKYIDNGLKQGVTEERMLANEQVLKTANLNRDLLQYLYSDDNGAKLVDYLARNPEKLSQLSGLPVAVAAVQIATEIKPKALSTKPHVTEAPDPAVPTRGGGKPPKDEMASYEVPGATFE